MGRFRPGRGAQWKPSFARCASAAFSNNLRNQYHPAIVALTVTGQELTDDAIEDVLMEAKTEYFKPMMTMIREAISESGDDDEYTDRDLAAMIR